MWTMCSAYGRSMGRRDCARSEAKCASRAFARRYHSSPAFVLGNSDSITGLVSRANV